jgi:hypothetical protein
MLLASPLIDRGYVSDAFLLKKTIHEARQQLPGDWFPIIEREAGAARSFHMRKAKRDPVAARGVWRGYLQEFGGAAAAQLSDADIKQQAKIYAREAEDIDLGLLIERPWHEYERLLKFCEGREVSPPPVNLLLSGMGARVRCRYWWRRALRKMIARKCERGFLSMGLVSLTNRQPYASNKAVFRRLDQNKRNAEALSSIIFENDAGYRATLADLAASSVSNKTIRRGELMTRIRGCEVIADTLGHAGLFCTLTAPSRFHSTLRHGSRNPKYDGSTPADAQKWHCKIWARARAKLARLGLGLYGFRVAEPHHDGCTHWHMLVWSDGDLQSVQDVLRAYWLSDDGDEKGAQKYRVAFKRMEQGGAAGYIAKYISKNIDDHGIKSHLDDYAEGAIEPDLIGDLEIKPSLGVEAWASTWGIRQFQPLGQPPVTVWRELRRVGEAQARAAGVGGIVHTAWMAAQKIAGVLADWARYVKAQGGMMLGRACRIKMRCEAREVVGLYGAGMRSMPLGVALNCKGSRTVWSERRFWRAVDVSASELDKRSASARTRVNNCTDDDAAALKIDRMRGPGGDFQGVGGKTIQGKIQNGNEKSGGTARNHNRYIN